jgi:radical SAM-linked protein
VTNTTFRIKFEKTGMIKYISHLDLNRLFSRSLVRAKIEVAHSEGYNPHPKIAFPSALSLGVESLCEFADVKITGEETAGQILEKTKGAFPSGINILEIYPPENDFKYIDRTRFHIYTKPEGFGAKELEALFAAGASVEKKPGVFIILKDYILELTVSDGPKYILVDTVLKTSPQMFLNPENIIKAVNLKFPADDYFIKKIEAYDKENNIFR